MLSGVVNEDLRSKKTEKALHNAMFSLLETQNFKKITIKGICERSLISRAAFYAHFVDKYDLLRRWIDDIWLVHFVGGEGNGKNESKSENQNEDNGSGGIGIFERLKKAFAANESRNLKILKNLFLDADNETMEILFDFLLSTQDLVLQKSADREQYCKNIVFANFYAGGILSYISWQIKNRFPPDAPVINKHFYEMIELLKGTKTNKADKDD